MVELPSHRPFDLFERPFDFGERRVQHASAGVEYDIAWSEPGPMQPEGFSQAALDAIALDRFGNRAWHGEAQARSGCGVGVHPGKTEGGEQGC